MNTLASFAGALSAALDGVLEGALALASAGDPDGDNANDDGSGLVDLQVGTRVFNDVPAAMRAELWLSALQRGGGAGAAAAGRFAELSAAAIPSTVADEIARDVHRTFPGHRRLGTPAGHAAMGRVLRAYAALDPEIGYSQGMNFLAGLFLAYLEEKDAFGALALVMRQRGLRELYRPDDGMALLQVRLWQLGRLAPRRAAAALEAAGCLPVLYASSWLLTCFAAEFPLPFAARVMDLVVASSYSAPLMKVAVRLLERAEPALLKADGLEAQVDVLRRELPAWPPARLADLLTEALARPWTPAQRAVLEQINGAESVADAVRRVEAAAGGADGGADGADGADGAEALTRGESALPSPVAKRAEARGRAALRIEPDLGGGDLDPAVSAALSAYASTALSAAAPPTPDAAPSASPASAVPPSPFASERPALPPAGSGAAAASSAGGTAAASASSFLESEFGSFIGVDEGGGGRAPSGGSDAPAAAASPAPASSPGGASSYASPAGTASLDLAAATSRAGLLQAAYLKDFAAAGKSTSKSGL
jgi:hypothetical protein